MKTKYWSILILLLLVIIFTIQNYPAVNLKLFFWSIKTSQAVLVYATLAIGIIIGILIRKRS